MADRITLTIRYDFKGQTHEPSVTIDLDQAMRNAGQLPDFLQVLAQANTIDPFSHEFEVLPHGDWLFSHPEGLAIVCLDGDDFDRHCFEQRWNKRERDRALADIARDTLGITQLDERPEIEQALLQACEYGQRHPRD